ncbi:MAG TPA: serine/threonine-protein kinase [Kofleriaceae bacterium]|nr:serine/threonine-protein kinase [Kofleriaceae bacterium]
MTAPIGDCLGDDELVAMTEGAAAPERVDAIIAHVDSCPACAEVVASLGAFDRAEGGVGRYRLERVLGAGGMGIVYAAWDPELRRRVAVKLVRPEQTDRASAARMLREARALASINHPNVVAVHDVGEHAGGVYVATELVDGETLATWTAGRGAAEIVGAWIQVARGLAAAHAEGVVHRDVKPSNALVSRDGRVRIGDFGLARQADEEAAAAAASRSQPAEPSESRDPIDSRAPIDSRVTGTGSIAGTPAYMAPEQRAGSVDARSDQFALCVAVAEALTGRRPAADAEVAAAPPALARALARGLRRDPTARFPSMEALADALAAAIAPAPPRLRRVAVVAVVAGAIAAGSLAAWSASRSRTAPCEVAAVPADLWPPARRARLGPAVQGSVGARIDGWLAGWTAASADVCASERDPPALRSRRQRCLASGLEAMREQLDAWQASPPGDVMAAYFALDRLPHASRCSRPSALVTVEPTATQAARIRPLRRAMFATTPAGAAATADAARRVEQARAIGYPPFTVDAMISLAAAQAERDLPSAIETLRGALAVADQAGDGWSHVAAATALLSLLGADATDQAERLAEDARARIAALGGDPAIEAELDYYLGNVWRAGRRHDEAIAALERARRGFRAANGPDDPHQAVVLVALAGVLLDRDPDSARGRTTLESAAAIFRKAGIAMPVSLPGDPAALIEQTTQLLALATAAGPSTEAVVDATYNLAIAYTLADQPEPALQHYRDAAALGQRLGLRSARIADALGQSAALLVELGRPREAIPVARRAVAMAEALAVDSALGAALTTLGAALLDADQASAAREPLRRALTIRDRLHESGRFRGNTRFLLARALVAGDPDRARSLAQAARVDLQGFLDGLAPGDTGGEHMRREQQARLDRIDRWLVEHR